MACVRATLKRVTRTRRPEWPADRRLRPHPRHGVIGRELVGQSERFVPDDGSPPPVEPHEHRPGARRREVAVRRTERVPSAIESERFDRSVSLMPDWRGTLGSILWDTGERFIEQGAMRHSAALAFYSILALAPLVMLVVSLTSLLFADLGTERMIVGQLDQIMGDQGMQIVENVLDNVPEVSEGIVGVIGSLVLLLFGGSVLFVNVQATLNLIWNVKAPERGIVKGFLKARLTAVVMIFATGAVLLLSTVLGAAAHWLTPLVERALPIGDTLVVLLELALSGAILTLLCAAAWRILPDVDIEWRDLWLGAAITSGLFLVGRTIIGWYLSNAAIKSSFGAAGSLVVFLMWIYYSAIVFFLGAEFIQVWTERRGRALEPATGAVRVKMTEIEAVEGESEQGAEDT